MGLQGLNVLITAGPTREMWDNLRYLTNLSTGKTGYAIARIFAKNGANVSLVSSIKDFDTKGIRFIYAESARDMFTAVKKELAGSCIFISTAAVADFRPLRSRKKIKKKTVLPVIELRKNPDILKWAGKNYPDKILVGYSLEDNIDLAEGIRKKNEKRCSIMVLNDTANLGSDTRTFTLIRDESVYEYKALTLDETARVVLNHCRKLL